MLAIDPQRAPTRDEELELGCLAEERGKRGSRIVNLLEVVDHEQRAALA